MIEENELDVPALVDMLARETEKYTQLMADGFKNGEEFSQAAEKILWLQQAIRAKTDFDFNKTITSSPDFAKYRL